MTILVTGAAGFIGFHTATALLARGDQVVGLDNLSAYYDVGLKNARLALLKDRKNFTFIRTSIEDREALARLFEQHKPERVLHLAAQPGVRYSLTNPVSYIDANLTGFFQVLDACRHHGVAHFVYASSSSVYGANTAMPFSVHQNVDHPLSLYGATKKANELMAHTYAHLYRLPTTGLRFFTVYGPWGRPDMSPFLFTRKILAGEPIDLFNEGRHARDFTYIDDIVECVVRALDRPAKPDSHWSGNDPDPASSAAPYRIYNVGNSNPVQLTDYVACIEQALGMTARKNLVPAQPGEMAATYADVEALKTEIGFEPRTPIAEGLKRFVAWYRDYYRV